MLKNPCLPSNEITNYQINKIIKSVTTSPPPTTLISTPKTRLPSNHPNKPLEINSLIMVQFQVNLKPKGY